MPSKVNGFYEVAHERSVDAHTLRCHGRPHAAIYMAGYAVECYLKAFLQRKGKKFPTSGREGHHLRDLWERTGFGLHTIAEHRRLFIHSWSTDLRYQTPSQTQLDYEALYQGAAGLISYLQTQIRRSHVRGKQ
jgi:HEPN domain-containing protein